MKLLWNNPFSNKEKDPEFKLRKEEFKSNKEMHDKDLAMTATDPNEFMMDGARAELIRWQQDLSPELNIMAMRLRNWYKNGDGEWEAKRLADGSDMPPLCNEECIGELVAILDPTLSRNLIMSFYDKEFIRKKLLDLANTLTILLGTERRRFEIRMSDLTPILRICQSTFEPGHFRALQANEKKYIGATHRYLHTEQDAKPDDKKKNWWPAS